MTLLLDTHVILWVAQVPDLLSEEASTALLETRDKRGLAISDKSLWELAMMITKESVRVKTSMQQFLYEVERRFLVLPITAAIAERSMQFSPRYPKDPADRIIGATALVHGMKLITADRPILRSGEVPCIW